MTERIEPPSEWLKLTIQIRLQLRQAVKHLVDVDCCQILSQRLIAERFYDGASVTLATSEGETGPSRPAEEVSFPRFVAELQGNAYRFVQNRRLES